MSSKQNPDSRDSRQPPRTVARRAGARGEREARPQHHHLRRTQLGVLVVIGGIVWGIVAATSANKTTSSAGSASQYNRHGRQG